MADQVIIRRAGHQELDTLDATDIPALGYDATGAAATAQAAAIAAAATDATTKANAAQAAAIAASAPVTHHTTHEAGGTDVVTVTPDPSIQAIQLLYYR